MARLARESSETFEQDPDLRDLIYFRLLCVSEAVRHAMQLDPDIVVRNPEIAWPQVRGLGNVLRHEYGDIDPRVIWSAFERKEIEALVTVARKELERLDD